ncbi:ceramide kinase-like isoform X2 [Littorina saxatilis]|uniref:ceramide kinase-like isoform X2 n=1 Tax=Littorina saxatilis TaxID=31220 RepID=UPI0038B603A8
MAASCEKILHQSVLELDNKQANVTLTPKYIAVEHIAKHKQGEGGMLDVKMTTIQCQVIPLEEVIAVQPHTANIAKDKFKMRNGGALYQAVELQPMHPTLFDVYIIKRAPKHRWRQKMLTFACKDHVTCSQWVEKIRDEIFAPGGKRPRQLLVFVNPFGGKKKAPKVFEKVRPTFDLAGVTMNVIETERQYHARDILQTYDLSTVDGVMCVGGDGTFSEVLNGLLNRSNKDEGIAQTFRHQPARPPLRIGVIPAGSTDSVVCSTIGTNDPLTSALQIIIGDSVGVDVNALYKQEQFVKYSVTMTSYGYYGDLLADSERLRWMGPKRYNWSGFKKIVMNKAYEGEVSFLPAEKSNGHPRDGTTCYTGCVVCQRAGKEAELANKALSKCASAPAFGSLNPDGWRTVSGKFVAINSVTVSCRCPLTPEGMSPYSHLGDGCMDLILVSDCSRVDYLRHMARIPRQGADQFDFNFIQVYRVREFQFRPAFDPEEEGGEEEGQAAEEEDLRSRSDGAASLSSTGGSQKSLKHSPSQNSVWNCDGEVIDHPKLHLQVHCQQVQLFARGVENHNMQEPEKCPVCCNPCSRC